MISPVFDSFFRRLCLQCYGAVHEAHLCFDCQALLEDQKIPPNPFPQALYTYEGMVQSLIKKSKFQPSELCARQLLETGLNSDQILSPLRHIKFDAITPVPFHPRRLLTRTYNLAFEFATLLSRKSKKPILDLLLCKKYSAPLTLSLDSAARSAINHEKFGIRRKVRPQRLLLVDDIITTGSTLHAAAQPLLNYGHSVIQLAFARTPLNKDKTCANA